MCGIAGVLAALPNFEIEILVKRMAASMSHRGPDDSGIWTEASAGIALGHRRLAILDLSPHGRQPMLSEGGRYVIVLNGEIYNFGLLRSELEAIGCAPPWRGHSDTEVLLAAIEAWGVEGALCRSRGMFAFALWDRSAKTLYLARDRVGEKPLYYGFAGDRFLFASELKAINAAVGAELQIDRIALAEYMRFGYIPAPLSIYCGISKLLPGYYLTFTPSSAITAPTRYWSPDGAPLQELTIELASCSEHELVARLDRELREAIGLQMVADVPLGAFLSGGIDSSSVVALMQAQGSHRIRTYTIGFHERRFDEAPFAKAVAQHLGTDHTELYVSADDAAEIIPMLAGIYDEPFADSSQIPTTLISRLTRQHVTVCLSGDGGDEVFSGYPRYQITAALWQRVSEMPLGPRRITANLLRGFSAQVWDRLLNFLPQSQRQRINGRRIHRLAQLITAEGLGEMYERLMSQWQPEDRVVLGSSREFSLSQDWPPSKDLVGALRRWDFQQYLPDDLMVKIDRASMSTSLETRAPFLDHRVVELAFALPARVLVRDGVGKWILRRVLDRYVPRKLIDRPKAGFSVPLGEWLRGPLREWAEDLLRQERIALEGYLDSQKVNLIWQQHLSGGFDRSLYLWNVLMFQAWLKSTMRAPNPC